MKKKFELVKTIQMILFFVITAAGLVIIFTDKTLYQMIGHDASVRILCGLLWLTLGLSFVFIFWDFSTHNSYKKDYRELDYAVYNDNIAGIANRYSCDAMIAKYVDQPLPPHVGCIMLQITNLRKINDEFGHLRGNEAIQDFSNILHTASLGVCFVGRNGGDKFMSLFEECDDLKMNTFLTRINEQIERNNTDPNHPRIEYATGTAISDVEHVEVITKLISLADRRVANRMDSITGFSNRASCDDVINLYIDKQLPENFACVMLDISNIREINEARGHAAGNIAIRAFGDILREAANGICFIGRNGGTKFLAVFENSGEEKLDSFLNTIREKTVIYLAGENAVPFRWRFGVATHKDEPESTVNVLVAHSDQALRNSSEEVLV